MSLDREILTRLKKVECPDATFFSMDPSLTLAKAKGDLVWDEGGHKYIDLCAGFGVHALGHNPDVLAPIWQDLLGSQPRVVHGMGDVFPSRDKAEFLEYLIAIMPDHLTKAALALGGGQAVELAVKSALLARRKPGIIAFNGGYHGLDLGALALTSREDFKTPFGSWTAEKTRAIFGL